MDRTVSRFPGLQNVLNFGKTCLINVLKAGPVPQHIAIVMDGNRRYAKRRKQEVREGHNAGFESLAATLELCYNAGVKVVTVFAFSIENFNRTPYEVESLMEVAKSRLNQLCEHGELAEQYGVRIKIVGDRSRLSPDVVEIVERAESTTKNNSKAVLNVCFPYTSRDEMAASIRKIVGKAKHHKISPASIDEHMIEENMYTGDSPELDILIRSSGVERFSDFMLWQSHNGTQIEFIDKLWPEFGFWDMYSILLRWSMRKASSGKDYEKDE
ncbi:dehydrodolichyl diphosphate synthase complex subunit Rer2p [Trichomonascus vanleenenianus]|uniref:ditrans,polycis-polyprenyl diphosphate synthase n=1 Tax=Trichomonascus vanleenenianus TaxID=2268995 RepID=UPI003ECA5D11